MSGHIRRRGERSWELKFDAGRDPLTDKRRVRYVSFKGAKRDAQRELTRLISEHASGVSIDPTKTTVAEFLKRWDRDYGEPNCTPKTLERYRQLIHKHITPNIGAIPIQKLQPSHLSEFYAKLVNETGLSGRTAEHVHRLLHNVLRRAQVLGIIRSNPASALKKKDRPVVNPSEISILDENQIARLLRHVEGRTLRPIISLALGTGARRGEVLALRLKDFDPDAGTIRIERSLEQTKTGLRFKSPKTKHGRRIISIPPFLVAELRAHIVKVQERRLSLGLGRAGPNDLLFPRWDGQVRSPHWLTQKFQLAMAALNIEGVTLHSLRHTHASQLIASGMDVLTISRRLGHGSPSITLAVYGHLFGNTDAKAAQLMETMFAGLRTD